MVKISALLDNYQLKLAKIEKDIMDVYLSDERPWIIGYSGGKDSTTVLQLVVRTLAKIPLESLKKKIYVISSDTLVETPMIKLQIETNLSKLSEYAKSMSLPIIPHIVKPSFDRTFWVNIIGRGYPTPNQSFRWCTDRMKIEPSNEFITDAVDKHGEVVMLLGIRKGESNSRDRVIDAHNVNNSLLMKHTTLRNAYVFAPIIEFTFDDVWNYLLTNESPWGANNAELYNLYSDSTGGECPLIVDKSIKESAGSCGNSRFGCWTCTVVSEDKSLSGFIKTGVDWLNELLEFRNWLTDIRDDREMRMKHRSHGQIYFVPIECKDNTIIIPTKSKRRKLKIFDDGYDEEGNFWNIFDSQDEAIEFIKDNDIELDKNGDPRIIVKKDDGYSMLGLGPFTFESRVLILKKLLSVQKRLKDKHGVDYELIQPEELSYINSIWIQKGFWDQTVEDIYGLIFEPNQINVDSKKSFDFIMEDVIEFVSKDNNVKSSLVKQLLALEVTSNGFNRRESIKKDIKKILSQEVLHL